MPCPHSWIVVAVPEISFTEALMPVLTWRQVVTSHSLMVEAYGHSPYTGKLEYTVLGRLPPSGAPRI